MRIAPDSTNQSVYVHLSNAADGLDATDLQASDLTVSYQRGNGSLVAVSLSDLSAITDAHQDGGVIHAGGGVYRIDAPDAAFASGVERVRLYVAADEVVLTAGLIEITLDAPVSSRLAEATFAPMVQEAASGQPQFTEEALANAPSGGGGGGGEDGGDPVTLTLTDANGNPIADALVWVTSDAGGSTLVQSGRTNDLGQVTFSLYDGLTYYRWAQKAGVNFVNPQEFVAVVDEE